jgi:putative membrane-bound dehydrogenase-like protein
MKTPLLALSLCFTATAFGAELRHPKFGFPLYTNVPPGAQMSGQWVAAGTPALSPGDEQRSFKLPPGFQARLFAAEPDVANPVAMNWDERGRLWVLELYDYPLGAGPGQKGRDRVKVLEDTDNDGVVDKVTVFADGFTLATGLLVGNGGVYVGEAPHLWFLEDIDGDGVADRKTEVLTGFGREDRHELLNGFTWGPDGQLYLTHGVFTKTEAVVPGAPKAPPVLITAGVARFNPRQKSVEVFAEGTSNPWGVDFDARGNAFVSACVIDHFFHLAPGGIYARQAGQPPYPYGYELIPSIVHHSHHMAAYAGVCIYQGDQWPASWRGEALMGNIHQNALNHDHLEPTGSSFTASAKDDFLTTKDGWFMPVSSQVGPDGALWVMDWYDKYPCYQNANADPQGVDRERGRIWRIVWVGDHPEQSIPSHVDGLDFAKLSNSGLIEHLSHPNVWQRRMAQRVLNGRKLEAQERDQLRQLAQSRSSNLEARLSAFWSLFSTGMVEEEDLEVAAHDPEAGLRMWSARFTGERRIGTEQTRARLALLASDSDPTVRSATASACRQWVSGQWTVNAPLPEGTALEEPSAALAALVEHAGTESDPTLDFLIWTASEPVIMNHPENALRWYQQHANPHLPLTGKLVFKTMRRFCDAQHPELMSLAMAFLAGLPTEADTLTIRGLDGLIEGQRGKAIVPDKGVGDSLTTLLHRSNPGIASRAMRLGALWGDATAVETLMARINQPGISEADRLEAIRASRSTHTTGAQKALLTLIAAPGPDVLKVEAIRALGEVGDHETPRRLLDSWSGFSPASRRATSELLSARSAWAGAFLAAIQSGDIKRGDVPPTVIRNLAGHRDAAVKALAIDVFGRVQATSAEKLRLIAEKRKVVSNGPIDLDAGHEVARRTCFVCHKLYGEGAEVGPDLTGVGRSSLDALLHNVINPNEIIGKGYENVEVETRDGRTLSGRLMENSGSRVRLLMAGPQEEIVAKSDVVQLRVSENSVMPEGLEQMPEADFRNLIWYILAPPQDGKPLTPERQKELLGGGEASVGPARMLPDTDGEAIALWAPGWQVDCPHVNGVPAKFPEYAGLNSVLATEPFDAKTPAAIVRAYVPSLGGKTVLKVAVSAASEAGWELRITADGEVVTRTEVTARRPDWQRLSVDLSRFEGRRLVLRLEQWPRQGLEATGYWADLQIEHETVADAKIHESGGSPNPSKGLESATPE